MPKVGDLEKRFTKPTLPFAPAKDPSACVAAATTVSASDRLSAIPAEIARETQLVALLEQITGSQDLAPARERLVKLTAERTKLEAGPARGVAASTHRMEQARSKYAGDAETRIEGQQRGTANALKRLEEDLAELDAAAQEIASRRVTLVAAHAVSAEAWLAFAAERAAYDAEVKSIFTIRISAAVPLIADPSDDADLADAPEDAAEEVGGMADFRLWVDPLIVGELPALVIGTASDQNKIVLNALAAVFSSLSPAEGAPCMTYGQLVGAAEQASCDTIRAMVGPAFWGGLYGPRMVTVDDYVPQQLVMSLRLQIMALQAQLPLDSAAVTAAASRIHQAKQAHGNLW